MEAARRERLVKLMATMASGDAAAVFALYEEYGAQVAATMRRHLSDLGASGIARDELDGLVMDACLALLDCAGAWDPDAGALPWTWASPRLRRIVAGSVGQHAGELDPGALAAEPAAADPAQVDAPALHVLDGLAGDVPTCTLLREALGRAGTPRDASILLEYGAQQQLGDPSPAHTVAALYGLEPPAVRKVVQRMRQRLRRLAAHEPRFGPLATLPLIA